MGVAVVAGAGPGIGGAVAKLFASKGYKEENLLPLL